jgi:hypothetical protein
MKQWIIRRPKSWQLSIILIIFLFVIARPLLWPGGFGIGLSQSITSTIEKDSHGTVTKYIETTTTNSGKTIWDWLSLLGVPISLLLLGSFLQKLQQERIDKQKEQDSEITKEFQRQKALKDYLNEVTHLLLDEAWSSNGKKVDEIKLLIRAKTLVVLGELDGTRKGYLVRFLVESEIIKNYPHLLKSADLSDAQLFGINLAGADLSATNFYKADLSIANLAKVNFTGANLIGTNLQGSILYGAILDVAILAGTNLKNANISSESQFEASSPATQRPYICSAYLPDSYFEDTNLKAIKCNRMRDCERVPQILVDRGYFKNFDEAKKVCREFKQ